MLLEGAEWIAILFHRRVHAVHLTEKGIS